MAYTCAICGKTYDKIADRTQCELNCAAEAEKRKKAETEKRLRTEMVMLEKKIEAKFNEAEQLIETYWERYNRLPNLSYFLKNDNITFSVGDTETTDKEKEKAYANDVAEDVFSKLIKTFLY